MKGKAGHDSIVRVLFEREELFVAYYSLDRNWQGGGRSVSFSLWILVGLTF
jgi:hypothetical protein